MNSDLIESLARLQEAFINNVNSFNSAVLSKLIYEIKIVPSVTTKDGFTQRGTSQRIISKISKSGVITYKTVVNKFAVADIFALSEGTPRKKIARVVLGPTNTVVFKPQIIDLDLIAKSLQFRLPFVPPTLIAPPTPPPIRH